MPTGRPVLSDCKVITHATPSLHEKCLICGKDIEEGQFDCKCGQRALVAGCLDGCITNDTYLADDGTSPTVKCTKCLVWGHRYCNDQSGYCWLCVDGLFLPATADNYVEEVDMELFSTMTQLDQSLSLAAPVGQEPEEEYEEEEEEDDFLFRVLTAPPSRLPISLNQYTGGDFPSHNDSSSNEDYSSSDED